MRPARKLATAVLALAVVTSVVYATGAFSSTTASRDANVRVAGDASAFLALQSSEGPNGEFANQGPNGELAVRMDGAFSRTSGVNPNSQTSLENVFTITNKGTQPVSVWLSGGKEAVTFIGPSGRAIESEGGAIRVTPGGNPVHVGIAIDARGVDPGADLLGSVTVHADPDVAGESVEKRRNDRDERRTNTGGASDGSTGSGPNAGQRTSKSFTSGSGSDSNEQTDSDDGDQCGGSWACHFKQGAKKTYDFTAGAGDYLSGSVDESIGKHTEQLYNNLEAGYNDIKDFSAKQLDHLRNFVTKKATGAVNFIQDNYKRLKQHKNQLQAMALATPGFYDDMVIWAIFHPEKVLNLSLGGVLGATGMPDGLLPVERSESIEYFAGWMAGSFVPVVDIIPDIRDTVQAAINGKIFETGIGLAAILPGAGKVGDVGQLAKYVEDYLGVFNKVDELRDAVRSGLLSRLPSNAKAKLIEHIPGISKRTDDAPLPVVAKQNGLTNREWARFTNEGYDPHRIKNLLDGGLGGDDIRRLTSRDVDLKKVEEIRGRGISGSDVGHYLDEGVSIDKIDELSAEGIPADDIRHYVDHGDDAYDTHIQRSMTVGGRKIKVGDGMSLEQVKTLRKQGFSPEDIRYYVDNGVSLKLVSSFRKYGGSSPETVKTAIKTYSSGQTFGEGYLLYNDIHDWCGLKSTNSTVCS